MMKSVPRAIAFLFVASVTGAVAGCAGDINPVRDVAVAVGVGPTAPQRPDFIETTRPASVDYVPIGSTGRPREAAKTADQVKAAEAELDQLRETATTQGAAAREAGAAAPAPVAPVIEPLPPPTPAPEPPRATRR